MNRYESREPDGFPIVLDKQTGAYYLTVYSYAKMAEKKVIDIEEKCGIQVAEQKKEEPQKDTYQVVYLGKDGEIGVRGRYLIPTKLAFNWLVVDCMVKALMMGGEALDSAAIYQFKSVIPDIKQGDTVRLKQDSEPVPVTDFNKQPKSYYLEREDLAKVLEYPTPPIYAGDPTDDAILLVRKWGNPEPLQVRVNISQLELMEENKHEK